MNRDKHPEACWFGSWGEDEVRKFHFIGRRINLRVAGANKAYIDLGGSVRRQGQGAESGGC